MCLVQDGVEEVPRPFHVDCGEVAAVGVLAWEVLGALVTPAFRLADLEENSVLEARDGVV